MADVRATDDRDRILIFGATSVIAQTIARLWAAQGASMVLVGRSVERLEIVRDDLTARGAGLVLCHELDFGDYRAYPRLVGRAAADLGGLSIVLVAHGELTDQARAEADPQYLVQQLEVNLLSPLVATATAANAFETQGGGTIIVIGSVAGDRGRRSNYAYGTAKAGVATFVEGLRSRLVSAGTRVLLVKPGRVDTPMTADLPKNFLFVSPEIVARDVLRAIERGVDEVYSPFYWRIVMGVIRGLPRHWFHKLRL